MKLYARVDDKILELEAVSICFQSQEDAVKFAEFAQFCSDRMRLLGDNYSHEHFAAGALPDLTIERLIKD
jgi:hypothetical protein